MKQLLKAIVVAAFTFGYNPMANAQGIILPGKGHINVEKLNKKIDTNMDISQLSLSELRVLRNSFAAKQGYCFMDATIREIYNTTTWYPDTLNGRWWIEDNEGKKLPLKYTPEERAFINKLKAREIQLEKQNFKVEGNNIVNTNNIINPYQLETMPPMLMDKLGRNGFAVVPALHNQLFQLYEKNDYNNFPSFITTDLFLQLYHVYFDYLLREAEKNKMYNTLNDMCGKYESFFSNGTWRERMHEKKTSQKKEDLLADDAEWCKTYFAIAQELMKSKKIEDVSLDKYGLTAEYNRMAKDELSKVFEEINATSEFLAPDYRDVGFSYSMFRPRGHYNSNDTLRCYFRTMMWLQTVPMITTYENQVRRAILLGIATLQDDVLPAYNDFTNAITYLMGRPDNVSVNQIGEKWLHSGMSIFDAKALKLFTKDIEQLAESQMRIRPKFENVGRYKINLMPQRYQPDGEAMLKMVDADSNISKRDDPDGLDIMASIGMPAAEKILLDELKEAQKWQAYPDSLASAKKLMATIDWNETITNRWMQSLTTLDDVEPNMPYFMKTSAWQKKALNGALSSWAELKHDAILYAKQPEMAECGGAGPEEPIVKGYIEPNVKFWKKAIELLDSTAVFFKLYNDKQPKKVTTAAENGEDEDFSEKTTTVAEDIREDLEFCLKMSEKELNGEEPSEMEYRKIEIMGSDIEYISLDLLRKPNQESFEWSDITSADKKVSLVADVFTSNGANVENKNVLYVATGPAYEIYVVVEIGGRLYLTRGAVLSYRQFKEDMSSPRLTDEEWQKQLETRPGRGVPAWMEEITVPSEAVPVDNEEVFYSSGC